MYSSFSYYIKTQLWIPTCYIPGNVLDLVNGRWFQVKADSGVGYEGVEGSPVADVDQHLTNTRHLNLNI